MALSVRQAARRLQITPRQVLRYIHTQELEAEQLGEGPTAPWMLSEASVERLREQRAAAPPRRGRKAQGTAATERSEEWRAS